MNAAGNTQKKRTHWVLILAGLAVEALYILYRVIPSTPAPAVIKYMLVYAGAFILVTVTFFLCKSQENTRFFFITVVFFAILYGITLAAAPPDQSDDIYRYLWDGKLQYYGISPYTYAPADPALLRYHSAALPALVNFPQIKTIYPPAAQLLFRLSYTLFGESVTGMKCVFFLALLGSTCFFYALLKARGAEARWLLFFAWNPLVIMETAVNGHLDIVMAFFVLAALWFFDKHKLIYSGIALACAVLTKMIPIILAPLFFFFILRTGTGKSPEAPVVSAPIKPLVNAMTRFYIPFISTITGFYLLYAESAQNMFHTAFNYSTTWYFNNPLFDMIHLIFKKNAAAHAVSFSVFLILYIIVTLSPLERDRKIITAVAVFVVCNPTIHPWYLVILLALLCLHRGAALVMWSGMVVITYFVVYQYKLTGVWRESWIILLIEYLPVLFLLIWRRYPHTPPNPLTSSPITETSE